MEGRDEKIQMNLASTVVGIVKVVDVSDEAESKMRLGRFTKHQLYLSKM